MMTENWEQSRGLWILDYNCFLHLVRASVEEVAVAMAADAISWESDVLGKAVVLQRDSVFVFQLKGHSWSIIVGRPFGQFPFGHIGYEWERALSHRLQRPVIEYGTSDTCETIGYTLIVDGEVVEELSWNGSLADEDDDEGPSVAEGITFHSSLRATSADEVGDPYNFVRNFFVQQDAFEPGIEFDYFFDHEPPPLGELGEVRNPGHQISCSGVVVRDTPVIERVDYLVLKSS